MSTLSVPLTSELESFINGMVRRGEAANKADVVRKALRRMAEEDAFEAIRQSQREMREGKVVYGNLREILKKTS